MFVIPMICLLAGVSEPMIVFLYTSRYSQVPLLLSLLLVPTLLIGIGSLSIGSFLNSQGDTGINLKISLISSATAIIVSPVFIWMWGVFGLALSLIVSSLVGSIFGLFVLGKRYNIYPDIGHSGRTLLSSLVSAAISYWVVSVISSVTPFIKLIIGSMIFFGVYIFLAPALGAIKEEDIDRLNSMSRNLGVVYSFIRVILCFERKIIRRIKGNKEN
jgi:O-antigen/teichoic acid export membrane protein